MSDGLRVLVTGGRTFRDALHLAATLDCYEIAVLAHGAALGADTLADEYARQRGIEVKRYPAAWEGPCMNTCKPGHRKPTPGSKKRTYCPAAGIYRNEDMLWDFKPDLVIAFKGGTGTADMIRRAIAMLDEEKVIRA